MLFCIPATVQRFFTPVLWSLSRPIAVWKPVTEVRHTDGQPGLWIV